MLRLFVHPMVLVEQGFRPVASSGCEGCQTAETADYNGESFRAELHTVHATPPKSRTSWPIRLAAISQYLSDSSIPIALRPRSFAARNVVPEPMNGSTMSWACVVLIAVEGDPDADLEAIEAFVALFGTDGSVTS